MRSPWIALAVLTVACGGPAPPEPREVAGRGHNVVLISIDTLRADRLSLYGHDRPTSPHLEAFARDAVVFENHFNNGGGTLPAHISMMTSLNPRTHWVNPHTERVLEEGRVTLAEVLHDAGYLTAGFADGGWMRGKFGFAQGFDLYDDEGGRLAKIQPKVERWLKKHHRETFFLFVHTYDVHSEWDRLPYECPDGGQNRYTAGFDVDFDGCRDGKCGSALFADLNTRLLEKRLAADQVFTADELEYIRALYDGCINYVDNRVAEVLDLLRELGVYDDSLVIVTSDHGEEFLEHGLLLHNQVGYDEFAHIPLIVKLPRGVAAGTRVSHLTTLVDLMPTVLEVLDLPLPPDAQGQSLLRTMLEDVPARQDVHMYETLRTERFKYFSKDHQLYDLEKDPLECQNVYSEHPELAQELDQRVTGLVALDVQLYDAFAERMAKGETFELTEDEVKDLKSLGYLE